MQILDIVEIRSTHSKNQHDEMNTTRSWIVESADFGCVTLCCLLSRVVVTTLLSCMRTGHSRLKEFIALEQPQMKDSVPAKQVDHTEHIWRFPQNISLRKTLRGHQDLCVCKSASSDTLNCQQRAICAKDELGFLLDSALACPGQ